MLLQGLLATAKVATLTEFSKLPVAVKNAACQGLINRQLDGLGYTQIGLQNNPNIKAKLVKGSYVTLFSFGWTEFDIKPNGNELEATT